MALDMKNDELLWVQKYRPQKVADAILPEKTKKIFQKFVDTLNDRNHDDKHRNSERNTQHRNQCLTFFAQ